MTRRLIESLDEQFARLHARGLSLARLVSPDALYLKPRESSPGGPPVYSCGEHLLRSAAAVEQTCGGIHSNLWDDPFEWTLPETLPTPDEVARYLGEVEATRRRVFQFFGDDRDLFKELAAPSGAMQTLVTLLLETLARAAHHEGRAYAAFRLHSDQRLPPV